MFEKFHRGDIYSADLSPGIGSEQSGSRPVLRILDAINQNFPDMQYITSYARADSITRKNPAELKALRQAGLNHLYSGMETGSDRILKLINKGFDADTVVRSGCMAKDADMILSEFILLGIGGKELSEENAAQTAKALNIIQPDFIRVHATGIKPESKLGEFVRDGSFTLQSEEEIVIEQAPDRICRSAPCRARQKASTPKRPVQLRSSADISKSSFLFLLPTLQMPFAQGIRFSLIIFRHFPFSFGQFNLQISPVIIG